MREWVVGGALLWSDEGLLLVHNRRRNGREDWTPPGGVIDEGETLLGGLAREVQEETGFTVTEWAGPLYEVRCTAPDMGWDLRVEVHAARAFEGSLHLADPDGIVIDARFVAPEALGAHLEGSQPWVIEPLVEWLAAPWEPEHTRPYGFVVSGADPDTIVVTRSEH